MLLPSPRSALALWSLCAFASAQDFAPPVPPAAAATFAIGGARVRIAADGTAAVSRDGGSSFAPLPATDPRLWLRAGTFDPQLGTPALPPSLGARAGARLFVVQARTAILPEYHDALVLAGLEVIAYLPAQAYAVRGGGDLRLRIAAQPWVRWIGEFPIGWKLDETLLEPAAEANKGALPIEVNVVLAQKSDRDALAARIDALGGAVTRRNDGSVYLQARLSPPQLAAVAAEDTVLWIDRATPIAVDVDNARIQGGANTVEALGGFSGQGVRVEISEGLDNTHPDWLLPPLVRYDGLEAHGHCTAAIIGDDGAGNPQARGILPSSQLIESSVFNWLTAGVSRYQLIRGSVDPAQPWQAMQQTASWGNTQTNLYTSVSQELDDALFDFDFACTQSMSNTGNQQARPQAWAKNVLSVGSVWHWNNPDPSDDVWTDGSIGPAADGRIKPDLTAYGEMVLCGDVVGAGGFDPGNYYASFSGTSAATPIVNGFLGLAQQMFTDGVFHNPLPQPATDANRFANRPHMATARALLLGTAASYPFSGSTANLTRVHQGWGFPDVARLYQNRNRMLVVDQYDPLAQGQERTYAVWIRPGTAQFRATMIYADPAAAPNATIHRVNDLDLRVTDLDGTVTWWGNQGLDVGNASIAGGARDDRDTVEQVWLQNPAAGIYKVTVSAPTIVVDGRRSTPQLDADYALVMHPFGGGYNDREGVTLDLQSTAPGDLRVLPGSVPAAGWNEGFTFFSFDTSGRQGFGPFFGVQADWLTATIYSAPTTVGDVFHFTNGGALRYPFVPFVFPPGLLLALRGVRVDAMVTLLQNGAITEQSNVARMTIQ